MKLFVEMDDDLKAVIEHAAQALIDLLDAIDIEEVEHDDDHEDPAQPPHLRGGNGWAPTRRRGPRAVK